MSEVTLIAGEADAGLRERLDQEISAFNAAATGDHDARLLSIAARGDSGDLHVGLYGWTCGGCGYVELLWVRGDQRGNGLEARLLAAAEAEIRRRGCDRVALDTHSSQAPGSGMPNAAARRATRTGTTASTCSSTSADPGNRRSGGHAA